MPTQTEKKSPFAPVYQIIRFVFDALLPERPTEVLVERLSQETLQRLARDDGALPYREECVRALVWEIKYYANPLAAKIAGVFLREELLAIAMEELGKPLILPVPIHKNRRRTRGHNQTELLAEAALQGAEELFDYDPHVLSRIRDTKQQQGLTKQVRLKNVAHSMNILDPARVLGRVCIVIDDVATTGATFAEARRALMSAGARKVHCLPLAQS